MILTHSKFNYFGINDQKEFYSTNLLVMSHQTCTHKKQKNSKNHRAQCPQVLLRTRLLKTHQMNKTIRIFFRISRRTIPKTNTT